MKKAAALLLFALSLTIIAVPAAIVLLFSQNSSQPQPAVQSAQNISARTLPQAIAKKSNAPAITVTVYRSAQKKTDRVALDDYLVGVVGSEMPASFHLEALKAQALAARTYIIGRIMSDPGTAVTDTVQNQVYNSRQDLKRIWGKDYNRKMAKIEMAVSQTEDEVITYQGKPITPVFFSTSNGKTENAADYWTADVPYLRSVPSPWDKFSPKYKAEKTLTVSEAESALGVKLGSGNGDLGKVLRRTSTNHVAVYRIAGRNFTGREVREKLSLGSTDFQLKQSGSRIVALTYGSGHDVGMSQYGADGMAGEGKSAAQIVTYYYQGTSISKMNVTANHAIAIK